MVVSEGKITWKVAEEDPRDYKEIRNPRIWQMQNRHGRRSIGEGFNEWLTWEGFDEEGKIRKMAGVVSVSLSHESVKRRWGGARYENQSERVWLVMKKRESYGVFP